MKRQPRRRAYPVSQDEYDLRMNELADQTIADHGAAEAAQIDLRNAIVKSIIEGFIKVSDCYTVSYRGAGKIRAEIIGSPVYVYIDVEVSEIPF